MTDQEFNVAVAAAKPAVGEFVGFDGSDSCEDCRGWDGESRRCDCGNRRVYWTEDDGIVYATAD